MKKFYLLFIFIALAGYGFGQTIVSYDFSDVGAVEGNDEASPGIPLDVNIGFGSFKNSSSTKPTIYSGQIRLYNNATKGGSIKIYASNGVTITQVIVHASSKTGSAAYTVDGGSETSLSGGTAYTMSDLSATSVVEFYSKDGGTRIYVDDFEVTYTSGGGDPNPEPTNHVTGFTAVANGSSQINLTWNDNDGVQAADGFLIVGKTG